MEEGTMRLYMLNTMRSGHSVLSRPRPNCRIMLGLAGRHPQGMRQLR